MKAPHPKKRIILFIQLLIIVALGFGIYSSAFRGGFIWDDWPLINNNENIRGWSNLGDIFTTDLGSGSSQRYGYYRPLQIFAYLIEYSIWGLTPFGYHVTNALLHIFVALAIYWLITVLFNSRTLSFLTSLLFLTHPLHSGTVMYISNRADLLCALFVLLCLIFCIKEAGAERPRHYILASLFYISALLSKENAVVVPALLLLLNYGLKKEIRPRLFFGILSVTFVYFILRTAFFRIPVFIEESQYIPLSGRIAGSFAAVAGYIRLFLLPVNLHMDYGNRAFSFLEPYVLLGILLSFVLLVYAFKVRQRNKLDLFCILWFFVTILPTTGIGTVKSFYMAENWAYLPSIGLFLLVSDKICRIWEIGRLRIFIILFLAAAVSAWSYLTIRQSGYWKEQGSFCRETIRRNPSSCNAYNMLATEYMLAGKYTEAITLYERILQINPGFAKTYYNIGNAYYLMGEFDKAIEMYSRVAGERPDDAEPYYGMGNIYNNLGREEESVAMFRKAIEIDPAYLPAYRNLAFIYSKNGEAENEAALYEKALENNLKYPEAYYYMADLYNKRGETGKAAGLHRKAMALEQDTGPLKISK